MIHILLQGSYTVNGSVFQLTLSYQYHSMCYYKVQSNLTEDEMLANE